MHRALSDDVEIIGQIPAVRSILDMVCRVTGMGFAAVARVTEDRWIACAVLDQIEFGLKPGGELQIATTICNEIRGTGLPVVIDSVADDQMFCGHPTPALYGFQSYISMPITMPDGSFFGTLCAIDPRPARVNTPEVVGMFKLFAELIALHLDAGRQLRASERELLDQHSKLAVSEDALRDERRTAELREQFIAVLGHDLRNPLAAISGGTSLLLRRVEDEKSQQVLRMMAASSLRMGALIENVMDFARGRLGSGISLQRVEGALTPMFNTILSEITGTYPHRQIEHVFDLDREFNGDHNRLGQLFSNLLANAITHGQEDCPVRIIAVSDASGLRLSIFNAGKPIPADIRGRLFHPFERGNGEASLQGLGLGLYIASEIARAHGGAIEVHSDEAETCFTFKAPHYTA